MHINKSDSYCLNFYLTRNCNGLILKLRDLEESCSFSENVILSYTSLDDMFSELCVESFDLTDDCLAE